MIKITIVLLFLLIIAIIVVIIFCPSPGMAILYVVGALIMGAIFDLPFMFERKDDITMEDTDDIYEMGDPILEEKDIKMTQGGEEVQTFNEDNMPILVQDDGLAHHVKAIKDRNTIIQRQLAALAKEMFTISMYTNQKEVIVDNCKMAVGMKPKDNQLRISLFLKQTDKKSSQYTWRDIVSDIRNEQALKPVISTIRGEQKRRRKKAKTGFANSLPSDKAIATYDVTTSWSVSWKDFDVQLGRLLPVARMLAQEQLKTLYEDTVSETAFMTSLDPIEEIPDEDIPPNS